MSWFTHLERCCVGFGRRQELQQQLDGVLLLGLNKIHTVDRPLVQLENRGEQAD